MNESVDSVCYPLVGCSFSRSVVLATLTSLTQIGELARRLSVSQTFQFIHLVAGSTSRLASQSDS